MSDRSPRACPAWGRSGFTATLALVLAAVFPFALLAGGGFSKVKIGERFIDFDARDVRGQEVSPKRFGNRHLVLAFVRAEQELSLRVLRDLQAIYSDVKAAGAEVLVIASDHGTRDWQQVIRENGLTLRLVLDTGEKIAEKAGLIAYPVTAVLGGESTLVASVLLHSYDFQKVILDEVKGLDRTGGGKLTAEEVARRRLEESHADARREIKSGHLRRALEIYNGLEGVDPDPYRVHLARGEILLRLGQPAAAARAFEKARAIHPQAARVLRGLGLAYARNGRDERAEPLLREAAGLDPEPGPVHRELSRIYRKAGDLDRALEHARKAVEAAERRRS